MEKIIVHVKPSSYPVYVGEQLIKNCGKWLKEQNIQGKIALISDEMVGELYANATEQGLRKYGYEVVPIRIPGGEENKSLLNVLGLLEELAKNHFHRNDYIMALGGGVIGDMAGLAAGLYMRGIGMIQVPTTLLACVDASVGGKTAVNLSSGKNLAGVFLQPKLVICDMDCLSTLSEKQWKEGMAEVLKTAFLAGGDLYQMVRAYQDSRTEENLRKVVQGCIRYKADIVEKDPTEKGLRKVLNFGHTIGHAIEKLSKYSVSHGEAVAYGMNLMICSLVNLGKISQIEGEEMITMMKKEKFSLKTPYDKEEIAKEVLFDKKAHQNGVSAVILSHVGHPEVVEYSIEEWMTIVESGMK